MVVLVHPVRRASVNDAGGGPDHADGPGVPALGVRGPASRGARVRVHVHLTTSIFLEVVADDEQSREEGRSAEVIVIISGGEDGVAVRGNTKASTPQWREDCVAAGNGVTQSQA